MNAHDDIRIGTLVPAHDRTTEVIRQLLPQGIETVQVSFGKCVGNAHLLRPRAAVARSVAWAAARAFRVALIASLGLLHPQILSLKAVPFEGAGQ